MRCKVGYLAIVVRSFAGNEGKIVTCIRLMENDRWSRLDGSVFREPKWLIDRVLPDHLGRLQPIMGDSQLRPIRNEPGADQSLRWAPVPKIETV